MRKFNYGGDILTYLTFQCAETGRKRTETSNSSFHHSLQPSPPATYEIMRIAATSQPQHMKHNRRARTWCIWRMPITLHPRSQPSSSTIQIETPSSIIRDMQRYRLTCQLIACWPVSLDTSTPFCTRTLCSAFIRKSIRTDCRPGFPCISHWPSHSNYVPVTQLRWIFGVAFPAIKFGMNGTRSHRTFRTYTTPTVWRVQFTNKILLLPIVK